MFIINFYNVLHFHFLTATNKSLMYTAKMASKYNEEVDLNEPGLIYIIQDATSDYFKVGVSTNENT